MIIDRLVLRAESEDRPLIGWSMHEIEVVERYCPPELAHRFRERYVDAKAVAKAARRQLGLALPPARGREKGHTLARYMRLVGHEVPWVFGPGWTGTTIRVLESALARHGDWARLTPRRKARWSSPAQPQPARLRGDPGGGAVGDGLPGAWWARCGRLNAWSQAPSSRHWPPGGALEHHPCHRSWHDRGASSSHGKHARSSSRTAHQHRRPHRHHGARRPRGHRARRHH